MAKKASARRSKSVAPVLTRNGQPVSFIESHSPGPMCLVYSNVHFPFVSTSYIVEARIRTDWDLNGISKTLASFGDKIGFSGHAAFTINQVGCSWHGFGSEAFIEALEAQEARYSEANLSKTHSSETALFIDEVSVNGGLSCLFWLAAQPYTGRPGMGHAYCGLLFSEIPFGSSRFEDFFNDVAEMPDGLQTWNWGEAPLYRATNPAGDVKPLALVTNEDRLVDTGRTWVSGVAFQRQAVEFVPQGGGALRSDVRADALRELNASEFWMAFVRGGWHFADDKVKYALLSAAITPLPAPGFGGALVNMSLVTEIEQDAKPPQTKTGSSGWPSPRELKRSLKQSRTRRP